MLEKSSSILEKSSSILEKFRLKKQDSGGKNTFCNYADNYRKVLTLISFYIEDIFDTKIVPNRADVFPKIYNMIFRKFLRKIWKDPLRDSERYS